MDLKERTDDWAEAKTILNTCQDVNSTTLQNLYSLLSNGF
jgi:hypothetical protein